MNGHLDPDELAAYHAGELSPEGERRVQDHLVRCRECAALLLDLDGLGDPDFGREEVLPAGAADTIWEGVREQIRREADPLAPIIPLEARRARSTALRSPRWLQALAASLLVATLSLSLWVASLQRTVQELSRPQANAPVLDLRSLTARGEGVPPPAVAVPADARLFTVILHPPPLRSQDEYRVEIARAGGGTVWSEGGLRPNRFGSLSLILPRRDLGTGEFRIRLFGTGPESTGQEEPLGEYALFVEP
jgi:hypothetical protein